MIIAVAADNKGTANSILATNLAAACAADSRRVLLLDAHSRRLSLIWSEQRRAAGIRPAIHAEAIAPSNISAQLENLTAHYDDIVIDSGEPGLLATGTALAFADRLIIPLHADGLTQAARDKLRKQLESARLSNPLLDTLFVIVSSEPEARLQALATVRTFIVTLAKASLMDATIHLGPQLYRPFAHGMAILEWRTPDKRTACVLGALYRQAFSFDERLPQQQRQTASLRRLARKIVRLSQIVFKLLT